MKPYWRPVVCFSVEIIPLSSVATPGQYGSLQQHTHTRHRQPRVQAAAQAPRRRRPGRDDGHVRRRRVVGGARRAAAHVRDRVRGLRRALLRATAALPPRARARRRAPRGARRALARRAPRGSGGGGRPLAAAGVRRGRAADRGRGRRERRACVGRPLRRRRRRAAARPAARGGRRARAGACIDSIEFSIRRDARRAIRFDFDATLPFPRARARTRAAAGDRVARRRPPVGRQDVPPAGDGARLFARRLVLRRLHGAGARDARAHAPPPAVASDLAP